MILRLYKKLISPLLPPACRFHPTCSAYAREAFERHGPVNGFILSLWRLLRCNPWNRGRLTDPVPEGFAWGRFIGYKRPKQS